MNERISSNHKFSVIRSDRTWKSGGGVCVLIPSVFKICSNDFTECNLKLLSSSKCDVMSFYLSYNGTKTRFILVYRPPNSCFDSRELSTCTLALHDLLINIAEPNCVNVLLGDFNLPI